MHEKLHRLPVMIMLSNWMGVTPWTKTPSDIRTEAIRLDKETLLMAQKMTPAPLTDHLIPEEKVAQASEEAIMDKRLRDLELKMSVQETEQKAATAKLAEKFESSRADFDSRIADLTGALKTLADTSVEVSPPAPLNLPPAPPSSPPTAHNPSHRPMN